MTLNGNTQRASAEHLAVGSKAARGGLGPRGIAALTRWAAASEGKLRSDWLPPLALTVARWIGAQVIAAYTGCGQRLALNWRLAQTGAEALAVSLT